MVLCPYRSISVNGMVNGIVNEVANEMVNEVMNEIINEKGDTTRFGMEGGILTVLSG